MLEELKNNARDLLENRTANVVIGYGKGSGKNVRPVFIRKPGEVEQLIFDEKCVQNLAVYLLKPEVKALGKPAIVAILPVMRTINQLTAENQIAEGEVTVIGISQEGTILKFTDLKSVGLYVSKIPSELTQEDKKRLEQIEELPPEERWAFWQQKLSACIKCYACRASCPLCYCSRCTVECNQPQWISVPSHKLGNMEWHIMRAMHLAGRCVNCGDCFRACPLEIPLNILTQKLAEEVIRNFGITAETEEGPIYPLSTFNPDDKADFIR